MIHKHTTDNLNSKFNFMKLPFIDTDSDLENSTLSSNTPCHLAVNKCCLLPKNCF